MRRCLAAFGVVLAVGLGGCREQVEPLRPPLAPPRSGGVEMHPLARGRKLDNPRTYMLLIRFRLITVELPIGSVSDSEELWSYVNEEPVGGRMGANLARNGIRVGVASEQIWPDVAKLLRRLTGKSLSRRHVVTHPGAAVATVLKAGQPPQRVFLFRPDRTLIGNDYPRCDNVLMMAGTINYDEPTDVYLTAGAVLRSVDRRSRYVESGPGYVLTSLPTYYRLEDMGFTVQIPAGGFVIVGPGPDVRRDTSPGHRFLVRTRRGLQFETILVIAPEVFAAPIRGGE